jgi:hypothetical protein
MKKIWVCDPQSGGKKIPETIKSRITRRILDHAEKNYAGKYNRIDVRFSGKFCYIDAYREPQVPKKFNSKLFGESREEHIKRLRDTPIHLCRLRFFSDDNRWSMAFYTYSHQKYEPCILKTGRWQGTPEDAFDTSPVYLTGW